jgi:fructose 1,6-bisphosphate aldolase/phosphatase
MKTTVSVLKADIGGLVGHVTMHPDIMDNADSILEKKRGEGLIKDYRVLACGDDLQLISTHTNGPDHEPLHKVCWDIFSSCADKARELGLYGAGQDLLADSFSGNVKGMGPGVAEMEFEERPSEPILIFMADKTSPGAWNLPLFKIFADPMCNPGLVVDPKIHDGFSFDVLDMKHNKHIRFNMPEDMYDSLIFIGSTEDFGIRAIYRKVDNEIAAVASTQRLAMIAGRYIGKDDPVMICRSQNGFPSVGEITEPFSFPHLVKGWMRGSHNGPIMPVSFEDAQCVRFDGPPRVICAGFQVKNAMMVGPVDMFDDPAFDEARRTANKIADYMRRHGPFEPHRLALGEMEYTTLPLVMEKVKDRFKALDK